MEEFLNTNGWSQIGNCNCGGTPRRKYYNPEYPQYKIHVLYTKGKFVILKNNTRYIDGEIENLFITLKNNGLKK